MDAIFSAIIEFLLDILGEVFLEVIFERGVHGLLEPFLSSSNKRPARWFVSYCLLGAFAGAISLHLVPHAIARPEHRVFALFLAPAFVGGLSMIVGRLRARRGFERTPLDQFSYGYAFAFAMLAIRAVFTR